MTRAEIARLLTFAAAYDSRTIGDADVLAWQQVVGDLDFDDAQAAVVGFYRDVADRRVMPADVVKRVRGMRADRLMRHPVEPPRDPDDEVSYRRELQAQVREIAAGYAAPARLGPAAEPPDAYRDAGRGDDDRARVLAVACPWPSCRASRGEACAGPDGKPLRKRACHDVRLRIANGEVVEPHEVSERASVAYESERLPRDARLPGDPTELRLPGHERAEAS